MGNRDLVESSARRLSKIVFERLGGKLVHAMILHMECSVWKNVSFWSGKGYMLTS